MQGDDDLDDERDGAPPYPAFRHLTNFLRHIKTGGRVDSIDSASMRKIPFSAQGQLRGALKFLGLMEADPNSKRPLPLLDEAAEAVDTAAWPTFVATRLFPRYAAMTKDFDLTVATTESLSDRMKAVYGVRGATLLRCVRFFISILEEGEIPKSKHIVAPTADPVPRKDPKKLQNGGRGGNSEMASTPNPPGPTPPAAGRMIINLYFDGDRHGTLDVPRDLTPDEVALITPQLESIKKRAELANKKRTDGAP